MRITRKKKGPCLREVSHRQGPLTIRGSISRLQSTTFKFDKADDMGALFDLEASGYFYTRLQNPTNDAVCLLYTSDAADD